MYFIFNKRKEVPDALMQSRTIQYFSLFLGVFALSTSAIFVKLADAPSSITAFYRLFFAALILLPLLLFKKRKSASSTLVV
jgi:drug/metabolite transporter (DMT)-like permease